MNNDKNHFTFLAMKNIRLYFVPVLLLVVLSACNPPNNSLIGTWKNNKGEILEFHKDQSALWLFDNDADGITDTFHLMYHANYEVEPIQVDLYDFETGPLAGVTMYGIVAFQGNSFKFDYEPGDSPDARPGDFDEAKTQTYIKQ